MLHFNQRNWFKMFPDDASDETLPEPRNRKEFYLSLLADHTPTKKLVLFSGYGAYRVEYIDSEAGVTSVVPTILIPAPRRMEDTTVMIGNRRCTFTRSIAEYSSIPYYYYMPSDSEIWIHVSSEADAANNKVVISKTVRLVPPQPKTTTEFYLAKMAGVEVVGHIEKVFEQEFTLESAGKGQGSSAIISNAYDEAIDASHFIVHIDGNDNHPFLVNLPGDGTVTISTEDGSYGGTTHTLELFYKEDVPVKTRTEQYLKAIAANKESKG